MALHPFHKTLNTAERLLDKGVKLQETGRQEIAASAFRKAKKIIEEHKKAEVAQNRYDQESFSEILKLIEDYSDKIGDLNLCLSNCVREPSSSIEQSNLAKERLDKLHIILRKIKLVVKSLSNRLGGLE